jgi:hypothetical protein
VKVATVKKDTGGVFARFKSGEVVRVHREPNRRTYMVVRAKSKAPYLPLANECVGVPRSMLYLHPKSCDCEACANEVAR